jgi:type VI secretion system protein ImpA
MLQKAVGETSAPFYKNLVEDLTQAEQEFAKLGAALDARCNGDVPASSNIRLALESCLTIVKDLARAKLPAAMPNVEVPTTVTPDSPGADAPTPPGATVESLGVIRSREDALSSLTKVAEYFRRTEPHSILSYALEQVISWGHMPLPELLAELIPDEAPRNSLFKQVGIRPPNSS